MPLGKRSCSTLIIWRFIGIAMVTPSTARKNTQASSVGRGRVPPVMSMYAANAEMSVPPVDEPAELAVGCMQLVSSVGLHRADGEWGGAPGGGPRRAGGGLHAVVLEDGQGRAHEPRPMERRPYGVGEDACGDRHAEAPARLEADVEVGEREHAAERRAHQHRAPGELGHAIA